MGEPWGSTDSPAPNVTLTGVGVLETIVPVSPPGERFSANFLLASTISTLLALLASLELFFGVVGRGRMGTISVVTGVGRWDAR